MFRHHLHTEIDIQAPAHVVWQALTDFAHLRKWNDFLLRIEGGRTVGDRLEVEMKLGDRKPMVMRPHIRAFETGRELRWLGRLGVPGIFDGEHRFLIEPVGEGVVRFVHDERFSGLLVGLLLKMLGDDLPEAFGAFNRALKARAEAMCVEDAQGGAGVDERVG